tara:strand:+ start:362 stop:766 length:405 start_codon:yes stop_codon:yes gene_type:complete
MNLKLVFRIYAVLGAIFVVGGTLSPEAMMEPYGFTMDEGMITMFNFLLGMQLIIILVTWQLPDWLGDNLSKAGLTFVVISLIPAVQGLYLMSTGRLPASTQGYIETVVWAVFAALFYFYSQQDDNSVIISDDEE